MGYRQNRSLIASPGGDAPEQSRQVTALLGRYRPGGVRQAAAQKRTSLSGLATQPLAGALEIARTQAGPGSRVSRRRELIHIKSEFGYQTPRRYPINARNRAQPGDIITERECVALDLLFHAFHLGFRVSQIIHQLCQHEPVVRSDPPRQRRLEFTDLIP